MSDRFICPLCGDVMKLTSLYMDGNHRYSHKYIGGLSGGKDRCPFDGETLPLRALQEIHRTRKALDVAVDALKSAHNYYEYCVQCEDNDCDTNWDCTAMNMDNDISEALEQITALEQKDVK